MSFTVFLGNLPVWVTGDDIRNWLSAENLVADAIKVIRNPETQESKGFAFIDAPNTDEMSAIIRRFDRAPLEDRLLRANPAQPPKPRGQFRPVSGPGGSSGPPSHARFNAGHTPVNAGHTPVNAGHTPVNAGHAPAGPVNASHPSATTPPVADQRPPRRGKKSVAKKPTSASGGPNTSFAEELAKAL